MVYSYATQDMTSNMAKAVKLSVPISTKSAIEIGRYIKGMNPKAAITFLETVTSMKAPMPLTQFVDNTGHRKGHIGPGSYPIHAATAFIAIIKNVVANAIHQSLDENKLIIHSVVVHKGAKTYKYSRVRGIKAKNTHVEIVVAEVEPKVRKPKVKKVHNEAPKDSK